MKTFLRNVGGSDLLEFALLAGLIAMAAGIVFPSVASTIQNTFQRVTNALHAAEGVDIDPTCHPNPDSTLNTSYCH